ncbi:MAG: ATP-dependent Clp protease adaptor ClpS [Clostridium thermopalmarium]|nr:ATP-dependent Clp protease adaptor ClpS [Clostridium thermopalmarium]
MYKVLLHNDDYTTMDFVVEILIKIFRKSPIEAERIMFDVHRKGIGIAGIYSYDIASTKIRQVMIMAEENGFPLKLTLEKE